MNRTELLIKQWSEKRHGKRPLGGTRYIWKNNITVDNIMYETGLTRNFYCKTFVCSHSCLCR
jgi:hypothetical protein